MADHPAGGRRATDGVPSPRRPMLLLPSTEDARRLARLTHPLSVSILMATTPADVLRPHDRDALDGLLREAERRLADERDIVGHPSGDIEVVRAGLASTAALAAAAPADRGLAILASPHGAHLHHLRVAPRDRVVVDPTFATRDLVHSAAQDPAFLMLVLGAQCGRLLHYDQRLTRPVLDDGFPVTSVGSPPRGGPVRDASQQGRTRTLLRSIGARLSAHLDAEGSRALPVVLIGPDRLVAEFLALTGSRGVAAVVPTGAIPAPLNVLERKARAALAGHVADRAAAALDTVRSRLAHGRAVAGLAEAWDAMRYAAPEVLVVEHSHAPAARLTDSGLELVQDSETPGILDDAVDELIEAALDRGAHVVTVPDGALAREGRVMLAYSGRRPALAG